MQRTPHTAFYCWLLQVGFHNNNAVQTRFALEGLLFRLPNKEFARGTGTHPSVVSHWRKYDDIVKRMKPYLTKILAFFGEVPLEDWQLATIPADQRLATLANHPLLGLVVKDKNLSDDEWLFLQHLETILPFQLTEELTSTMLATFRSTIGKPTKAP